MTTLITIGLKKLFATLVFSIIASSALATDYQTIGSGNWNDPTIWSTDGGATNCGCVPSSPTAGDNIDIYHSVTSTQHIMVSGGSVFTVHGWGRYEGGYNFTVVGGSTADLYGQCSFLKLINGNNAGTNGGTINIYNTAVGITGQVRLNAGTTTVQGYLYLLAGNFNVYPNATFITSSGAKLEVFIGNISIEGTVDICADCCLTTQGNWTNEVTGVVSGSGSATSVVGNMSNFGTFSPTITWCSAGADVGMPSPENCGTSNTTCGAVSLPVELLEFRGDAMGEFNLISWATASEKDCRNFVVTYSTDGMDWYALETVNCVGNTDDMTFYEYRDYVHNNVVAYYRLEQTDLDGNVHYSAPISIAPTAPHELRTYPNPVTSGNTVFLTGTEAGGTLRLYGPTGSLINQTYITQDSGSTTTLETTDLVQGVYLVEYTAPSTGVIRTKFVVQ